MGRNIFIGKAGEQIAEDFLKSKRFKILERNLRTPFGEIDLIALEKNTVVFVEVKTRISEKFGAPLLSITEVKKKNIIKNASYYLCKYCVTNIKARIDVISINLNQKYEFEKLVYLRSAIWVRS